MTTPWIDAKGIHTFYGSSHILHGIDFTVGQGETIGLMGRNGMGKSTLLKSLMGLVKPRSGSVAVAGRDMTGKPPYEVARLGIGRTFQTATVFEQLYPAKDGGLSLPYPFSALVADLKAWLPAPPAAAVPAVNQAYTV